MEPIWGKRSEIVQRLLRETCELCGATAMLQAHHVRKLADLTRDGQRDVPLGSGGWLRGDASRSWSANAATTLFTTGATMDQPSRIGVTGEPRDTEMVMRGSGEGRWKRTVLYLAGGLSYRSTFC